MSEVEFVRGSQVDVAFERSGDRGGWPVVLLHGFPYDPRCYDDVVDGLVADGAHVVVPYLRGFGPTSYLTADGPRSGQQAALGGDLRDLILGLELDRPIVGGFDWGGRAACVVAMLWPELVSGLVTVAGYNVHDIETMATTPDVPQVESRNWYQWYLQSERGRRGLQAHRSQFARQLWQEWSPTWEIPAGAFARTQRSFDNSDFVDTVVHSYRHRYGLAPGDPMHASSEMVIAHQPPIRVPTIVLDPTTDPLERPQTRSAHLEHFPHLLDHRLVDAGHNVPQENPVSFLDAVRDLRTASAAQPFESSSSEPSSP